MIIMVCYDYEEADDRVLSVGKSQASAFDAVVHVVASHPGGHTEGAGKQKARKMGAEVEKIEHGLREARAFYEDAGIACRTHLSMRGLDPGEDLVLYAREHKVDTLVIGIKKRSRMDKMIFGSTAQYVLLNARVPIVSVPLFF